MKMTPRIPPKNAANFSPGNVIRLEFPAQGYVNTGKTTLEFDVDIVWDPTDIDGSYVRFQNNIQSIFNRVRLLYGATPLEDIPYYNVIVRQLTEWTGTEGYDQTSINEGIGNTCVFPRDNSVAANAPEPFSNTAERQNVRQYLIHGVDARFSAAVDGAGAVSSLMDYTSVVPNQATPSGTSALGTLVDQVGDTRIHANLYKGYATRRYQVQLMLGIFNQEKLLPTKYMASQLAIEITLENASSCMYYRPSSAMTTVPSTNIAYGTPSTEPSYRVRNVNLIPEILEFDASYDETFMRGLQENGVPIKFCTWNNFRFSNNGVSSVNLQIQERSRSVKSIFVMQRRDPPSIITDSGATFFDTGVSAIGGASTLQEYQFRIGGRYIYTKKIFPCATCPMLYVCWRFLLKRGL